MACRAIHLGFELIDLLEVRLEAGMRRIHGRQRRHQLDRMIGQILVLE